VSQGISLSCYNADHLPMGHGVPDCVYDYVSSI
jgi:hypothetical protein